VLLLTEADGYHMCEAEVFLLLKIVSVGKNVCLLTSFIHAGFD